jgi:hypothetical protein
MSIRFLFALWKKGRIVLCFSQPVLIIPAIDIAKDNLSIEAS